MNDFLFGNCRRIDNKNFHNDYDDDKNFNQGLLKRKWKRQGMGMLKASSSMLLFSDSSSSFLDPNRWKCLFVEQTNRRLFYCVCLPMDTLPVRLTIHQYSSKQASSELRKTTRWSSFSGVERELKNTTIGVVVFIVSFSLTLPMLLLAWLDISVCVCVCLCRFFSTSYFYSKETRA